MPYALIPDGFTLKKVTKAQEEAVKAKRRHDNVQAFIENENTPLLVGAGALVLSAPFLVGLLLQAQEDALNITLTDKQKSDLPCDGLAPTITSSPLDKPLILLFNDGKKFKPI